MLAYFWALYSFPFVSLFLGRSQADFVTLALPYNLKSGIVIPPAVFSLLGIALGIYSLLWFHMSSCVVFPRSVKCHIRNLIGIELNLYANIKQYSHFHNINSDNP